MVDTARWFDERWYLLRNPDVARVGINALAHYWRYGEAEGRFPSPWFDPAWYRTAHALHPEQSPLEHFLAHRITARFPPCAALYMVPLTPPWGDAIAAGLDPFDAYLTAMELPERELLPELAPLRSSGLIEPAYHRINQADRHIGELDPVLHHCRFGWRLGWRPNTAFDPVWYKETNPDAARLRINPLMHYILEGEPASRRPCPWFDPAWYRTEHAVPADRLALAHYLEHRHTGTVSPNPLFDAAWYVARHGGTIPPGVDPFSHYLALGAMEDIDPSPRFDARAWRHLHMAPLGHTAPLGHMTPLEHTAPLGHMAPLETMSQHHQPAAARNPLVHYFRHMHETGHGTAPAGATIGRRDADMTGILPP